MSKGRKRIAPEVVEAEAALLKKLWEKADHPERGTQAEFGEKHGIGSQGLMWQLLNGKTPISLGAAKSFASGLGCNVADFSPRLAALETAWPFELIDREWYESLSLAQKHRAQMRMKFEMEEIAAEMAQKANGTSHARALSDPT